MRRIWTIVTVALLASLSPTAPAHAGLEMYAIHSDHLGTPRVITDKDQRVVWRGNPRPFGSMEVEVEEITHHQRFPGQRFDIESGRHYNYFRDYDPSLGRYIQSDPTGLKGGFNTYGYSYQNPLNFYDPYGLRPTKDPKKYGQPIEFSCRQICVTNFMGSSLFAAGVGYGLGYLAGSSMGLLTAAHTASNTSSAYGYFDLASCLRDCKNEQDRTEEEGCE